MPLARTARRKSVCLTPSGMVVRICFGFAGVLAVLLAMGSKSVGGQPTEAPTGQEKAKGQAEGGGSELIAWVVGVDRDGIAIALNDLRESHNRTILMRRCDTNKLTDKLTDLHAVVRDLIDDKHVETMYPFSLTIKETRSGPSSHARSCTVRFKFAKNGSLSGAWRPLFDCASTVDCASTGKTLESFAKTYQDDGSTLTDRLLRLLAGDPLPAPRWLKDLDWYRKLRCDLKAAGDGPRVIILGPNTSDDVPALWFLLDCLKRHDGIVTIPPIVSTAATWSALKDDKKISYWEDDPGRGCACPDRGAASALSPWVVTLGRALGLSADGDHFRFAREMDKDAMCEATKAAQKIAASFIQYAQPDNILVDEIHRQLVGVRGYRRVAILYRDSMADVQR